MRGFCEREGLPRIGFGECRGHRSAGEGRVTVRNELAARGGEKVAEGRMRGRPSPGASRHPLPHAGEGTALNSRP